MTLLRTYRRILTTVALTANGFLAAHADPVDHARRFAQIPIPNLEPSFTWLDSHRVLAKVEGADGTVAFRITDARTDTSRAAFDQDALARALSAALGRPIEGSRLPITRVGRVNETLLALVEPELRAFAITDDGREVDSFDLADATPFLLPAGRRAVQGDGAATVHFVNRLDNDVQIYWLNGGRRYDYGTLASGDTKRQGTYTAHAWIAVDADGHEYGPFVADETLAIALIHPSTHTDKDAADETPADLPASNRLWDADIEAHNIVLRHRQTGESRQITSDGTPEDYYRMDLHWSPDGTTLFAMRTRPSERRTVHIVESSPRDQQQPTLQSFAYRKPGDAIDHHRPMLFTVDRDTGESTTIAIDNALFETPWSPFRDVVWHSNGSEVFFTYVERGHRIARVIGVDAKTGESRIRIDEAPETFFDYAYKMYFEPIRDMREAIWMSERSGWNHLHRFDLTSGTHLGPITSGPWVVRSIERIDHNTEQIWFRAMGVYPDQDPYHVHFGRVSFDGTDLTWLTSADGTHSIQYSPNGEYLIARASRADLAPVHELRRVSDGSLIAELTRADTDQLSAAGWRPPDVFRAKGRDGETDIWGLIYTPTDFSPDKMYPVVEQIYAGPHGFHVPKQFARWHGGPRQVAELGFVVVQIDGMGTSWRHKAFHDVAWKNLADGGFPDRIAWMREAATTRPWMDLTRVGIYGGSAGGQNAMAALLHHNDFYSVAIADCGCHDNRMDKIWWNELWMGWPIDNAAYDASSNVTQAHRLEGELLLIVGELDRNVDPASTMQVVDALIRADKDFDMLVIPGVGHSAGDTPYGRRRTLDFLVEHLHGSTGK
ncbi:MAG: prolyl oligopeptidase family serine peptidase [Planctomycetota bacterium]